MLRRMLAVFTIPGLIATPGCSSLNAPPDTGEEVRIVLSQAGGIAGVDWQVTIDGASGRVIGDRCRADLNCDWEPGEVLATVEEEEVLGLADQFFVHGFFDGDDDYGTECCDQFEYSLSYEDEDQDRTVSGSSERLPENILDLIQVVQAFVGDARG